MKSVTYPLLAALTILSQAAAAQEKPNIVFLLVDDLGWGELTPYGNDFNETPNITSMAEKGVLFTNAYAACPVSSPTRASFYTGQYTPRHGITDFLSENSSNYLHPEAHVTINEALKGAGYTTGMVGKWHLDTNFKENPGAPSKQGYDWVFGTETKYIAGGDYFYPYDKISTIVDGVNGDFLSDRLCREAMAFMENNKDNPFFISIQLYSVHMTVEAPENLVAKYKAKYDTKYGAGASKKFDISSPRHAGSPDNPYLAGMIEKIDDNVGLIIDKIEKLGISDNTIFILTSDNGGDEPAANNGGLNQYKTWLYEGGIRVPLIIKYPNKTDENIICDVPVNTIDFYPTFCELAKASTTQQLDGESILPLLHKGGSLKRKELFWYYPAGLRDWNPRKGCVVRQGDYKLLYRFALAPDNYELYNLKEDPYEKNNIANSQPEKLASLKILLHNWMDEMKIPRWKEGATYPIFDFETEYPTIWGTNGNPSNNSANEDHINNTIVENPDKLGINTSNRVGCFNKVIGSTWWAYAWFNFKDQYMPASNKTPLYLHVMVRKPIQSTVCVQMVGDNNASTAEIQQQNSKVNEWEDMVFMFTQPNTYNSIQFKADFVNDGNTTEEMQIYFDEIIINNDPTPRGDVESKTYEWNVTNFESGFYGLSGTNANDGKNEVKADPDHFYIVANPTKGSLNKSGNVACFNRLKDGLWWSYAWFEFKPITINTTPQYLHVLVNKPITSTICAQIKDKAKTPISNSGEMKSDALNETDQWQDIVFKINNPGTYSYFEFKPDFTNPSGASKFGNDLNIYFDEIIINNDPNPRNISLGQMKLLEDKSIQIESSSISNLYTLQSNSRDRITTFLYTINGKFLTQQLSAENIDLRHLPTGIYIVKAIQGNQSASFKLTKN